MTRFTRRLVLACLIVLTACVTASGRARAADQEKADKADKKRQELWQALEKALPKKYQPIEAYAENPSLTVVLFRSQGATLRFSFKTRKVEQVQHMKLLGRINRITFEERKDEGAWVLWYNGQRELTIAETEK